MRIETYKPCYKDSFVKMNKAWITEMFKLEPEDVRVLENIEEELAKGAQIFFAVDETNYSVMS